jgi:hypothetical protein
MIRWLRYRRLVALSFIFAIICGALTFRPRAVVGTAPQSLLPSISWPLRIYRRPLAGPWRNDICLAIQWRGQDHGMLFFTPTDVQRLKTGFRRFITGLAP